MLVISDKSNIIVFGGANMIITTSMLRERYASYSNPMDKIRREAKSGIIIRIKEEFMRRTEELIHFFLRHPFCLRHI